MAGIVLSPTDSSTAPAILTLAQDDISRGDADEALATLDRMQAAGVQPERARRLRVAALAAEGDLDEALVVSEALLTEAPEDRRLIATHARLLSEAGRTEESLALLERRGTAEGGQVGDYVLYAEGLLREARYDEAVETARRGIEAHPGSEDLYILAYMAQKQSGDQEAAFEAMSGVADAVERPVRALTLVSNDYIVANRNDEAIAALRTLQERGALQPLTANNLASLLLETEGNEAEALEIARRFEDTDNPFFADTLAWAYYKSGQVEDASRLSRAAADGAPKNADILYHRGVIAKAEGDRPSARSALEAARRARNAEGGASAQVTLADIDAALEGL